MWGLIGLGIVIASGVVWFRRINAVAIPRNRLPFQVAFAVGALLGVFAIVQGEGLLGMISGGIAAFSGTMFLLLRLQSSQKPNEPVVSVGDPILAFSALDENGAEFDLSTLQGKPYLLKFFRGHW